MDVDEVSGVSYRAAELASIASSSGDLPPLTSSPSVVEDEMNGTGGDETSSVGEWGFTNAIFIGLAEVL